MPTPQVLPLEDLLQPIPGEMPCGESLRWDDLWTQIKNARSSTTDAVDASVDLDANWQQVLELSSEALVNRTKDLMLAAWLTEAAIKVHGLAGLRDGLRLLRALCDTYWDDLHPLADDGDLEVRAAPLVWISDGDGGAQLPNLLRLVPLAIAKAGGDDEQEALSYMLWNARFAKPQGENEDDAAFANRRQQAEQKKERFEAAVSATAKDFYLQSHEDLQASKDEIESLNGMLDEKLGIEIAPSWVAARNALDEISTLVVRIINDKGGFPVDDDGESTDDQTESGAAAQGSANGPIKTRGDAIRHLAEAADYLRRTEPHSPVAYLVDRAVRWANKPFKDVLADLIKDDGVLGQIGETLGLGDETPNEE